MNVGRGLFRAWICLTVLWLIGAGWSAYESIPREILRGKWGYVNEVRDDVDPNNLDVSLPYYENMRSPSDERIAVTFYELEYQLSSDWDKAVRAGEVAFKKMPDGSSLYLDPRLTKDDQEYLAEAFWDQRSWRYAGLIWHWLPIFVVPPIVLFILGWVILWVCRGFKTA